jgi:hypothetical protein
VSAPKVLFIVGFPRSGSTLLGRLLHEIEGVFFAGELAHLWSLVARRSQILCGCGERLLECPRWREILERCAAPPVEDVLDLQRRARRAAGTGPRGRRDIAATAEYLGVCARLAEAIQISTGAELIVDSSKIPADALLGARVPSVATRFVHLVRDPRGAVFSRQRNRDLRLAEHRHPRPWLARRRKALLVADALAWVRSGRVAERLVAPMAEGRFSRLRYEDLVAEPLRVVADLARESAIEPGSMPFLDGHRATFGVNHSISGNRNRAERGVVEISPDLAWQQGLTSVESRWIAALTGSVARRYGYV